MMNGPVALPARPFAAKLGRRRGGVELAVASVVSVVSVTGAGGDRSPPRQPAPADHLPTRAGRPGVEAPRPRRLSDPLVDDADVSPARVPIASPPQVHARGERTGDGHERDCQRDQCRARSMSLRVRLMDNGSVLGRALALRTRARALGPVPPSRLSRKGGRTHPDAGAPPAAFVAERTSRAALGVDGHAAHKVRSRRLAGMSKDQGGRSVTVAHPLAARRSCARCASSSSETGCQGAAR